jgi:hypothetical protein
VLLYTVGLWTTMQTFDKPEFVSTFSEVMEAFQDWLTACKLLGLQAVTA